MTEADYKIITNYKTWSGQAGTLGVEIRATEAVSDEIKGMCRDFLTTLHEAILTVKVSNDPAKIEAGEAEIGLLTGLFPQPIYVERIPYGYCHQHCCSHRRWLIVTTHRGRIQIGWRKRVINIDWSGSDIKSTAADLFPKEDVTKGERSIHAWGYEKAAEYLAILLKGEINGK